MTVDRFGIKFIQSYESCSLKPYICPAGVPTIGWGNTFYKNGAKVTMKDRSITQAEADELFYFVLSMFQRDVSKLVTKLLTQNQFNALVSFAYNVGTDIDADNIPEGLGDSTLLKKININPNDPSIANEFAKWNKSNSIVLLGLTRRREAEAKMYFS